MSDTVTGRCNCGSYELTIPKPDKLGLCHCVDCKRWSGSMYSAHLLIAASTLQITGPEPKTFQMKGAKGGTMTRAWCDGCGSGLWIRPEASPNFLGVKAGLFDKDVIPHPTMELYERNMCSWEVQSPAAKHFEAGLEATPTLNTV